MKTSTFLFGLPLLAVPLFAQNPLVGTWEMTEDTLYSIKVITPTHWMIYTESSKGGKKTPVRTQGGTYRVTGNRYIGNITIASWEDYGKEKNRFYVYHPGRYVSPERHADPGRRYAVPG